jgi:ABC-2 type transport system ATP-binding protein
MQQKVAIGCALIADPPVVMLDEPTLGLDVQAVVAVRHLIKTLVEDEGKTVILTTHQLDMAEALCDRVAIINKGRIVADQPVASLLALFREKTYRIKVEGRLAETAVASLGDVSVDIVNGDTVLRGPIDHTEVLYDLIARLRSLGVRLLSVQETEPSLEDVFLRMVAAGDGEGA